MGHALYDRIGRQYISTRRADPRIAAAIVNALDSARTVVNVGAGPGAYEPVGCSLVAVEPSRQMIEQRSAGSPRAVQASAEALPFRSSTFDAALAVLTVHHWSDWRRGLAEMRRVAGRLVIFTFEPRELDRFWLIESYFPEMAGVVRGQGPSIDDLVEELGNCRVDRIAVPHDCADGFLAAFWRRPAAYLDGDVRASMSAFALLEPAVIDRGVARLKADLDSGEWERRFGYLGSLAALDVCYRLITVPG